MEIKRLCCAVILIMMALTAQNTNAQQPGSAATTRHSVTPALGAQDKQRPTDETRAPQMRRSAAGSMTGRVLAEGGQPLAGAIVSVQAVGSRRVRPRSAGTGPDGKFRVDDLAPGAYYVIVNAPGYVRVSDAPVGRREQRFYRPGDAVAITMMKGGVITGTVTDSDGEPVVAILVGAIRVRDAGGRPVRGETPLSFRWTDDRGIYRLYGLEPGSYVVTANSYSPYYGGPANKGQTPTYYPSATRDTATEVALGSGQEVSAIDIRFRSELGHTVSGTLSGELRRANPNSGDNIAIVLSHVSSGAVESVTHVAAWQQPRAFALDGVPNGDYYIFARGESGENIVASPLRRIKVSGADVTGLQLSLVPLGSISGRIVLETAKSTERKVECQTRRGGPFLPEEAVVNARRDKAGTPTDQLPSWFTTAEEQSPDAQGNFELRGLMAGSYHIVTWLPGDDWYVRAITLPAATPGGRIVDATRAAIALHASERLQGLSITLAEGAAGLRGRVTAAVEGARLQPVSLRVHLVPAERENADATLRFAESPVFDNGAFAFTNIAPGRYWLLARPIAESDSAETTPRPIAWDAEARARLRREAETANMVVDLQPCQLIPDYVLRYTR